MGGVNAGLGFRRSRFDASSEPRQLAAGQVLPSLFGRGGLLFAFSLGLEQLGVTTGVGVGVAAINLQHAGRHLIEQEAVVTDEHDGALEGLDLLFEPLNSSEVEMVRWFVQNQNVIGIGKDASQGHPLELTTREGVDLGIDGLQHAQTIEGGVNFPTTTERLAHRALGQVGNLL